MGKTIPKPNPAIEAITIEKGITLLAGAGFQKIILDKLASLGGKYVNVIKHAAIKGGDPKLSSKDYILTDIVGAIVLSKGDNGEVDTVSATDMLKEHIQKWKVMYEIGFVDTTINTWLRNLDAGKITLDDVVYGMKNNLSELNLNERVAKVIYSN